MKVGKMIVNWNKPNAGVKLIPAQNERNDIIGNIVLLPGYNDVNDTLWEAARKNLNRDPEGKYIEEISKEVKSKELPKSGVKEAYKKEVIKGLAPKLTFDISYISSR